MLTPLPTDPQPERRHPVPDSDEIDAILLAAAAALTPSPDISGCPDTVAMLAAAVLRTTGAAAGTHWSARLIREAAERAAADAPEASDGGRVS